MAMKNVHSIDVWGDFACFTNPVSKVERFSYPVMTPGSARGILDAIYWRKTFYWKVFKIEILKPVKYVSFMRSELKSVANVKSENEIQSLLVDGLRTQRQTMALKDVHYRISAMIEMRDSNDYDQLNIEEYNFLKRVKDGQCFHQPSLGCKEFTAFFSLSKGSEDPVPFDFDIGWMVYDVFDLNETNDSMCSPSVSLFKASIVSGVLNIPDYNAESVRKIS